MSLWGRCVRIVVQLPDWQANKLSLKEIIIPPHRRASAYPVWKLPPERLLDSCVRASSKVWEHSTWYLQAWHLTYELRASTKRKMRSLWLPIFVKWESSRLILWNSQRVFQNCIRSHLTYVQVRVSHVDLPWHNHPTYRHIGRLLGRATLYKKQLRIFLLSISRNMVPKLILNISFKSLWAKLFHGCWAMAKLLIHSDC